MHRYTATIHWQRHDAIFTDRRYSRAHVWSFDGGVQVPASASPLIVPLPMSEAQAVDPEEALVASVSSCHMLFFLDFAAQAGFVVDDYQDHASATMGLDAQGREFVERIVLAPKIVYSGVRLPAPEDVAALHERAHHHCFIANSLKTQVLIAD